MPQLNSHQFMSVYKDLDIDIDKLGCVMADIEPLDSMRSISDKGESDVLYYAQNSERKWIKGWIAGKTAHITLLYGLLQNAHTWADQVHAVLDGWELDEVEIDKVDYFESPYEDEPYYCIIAHIKVDEKLLEGHQRLEFLPHINTFTDFKPHMTICYIKKDEQVRDSLITLFNKLWAGAKLKVNKEVNLGYAPGEK